MTPSHSPLLQRGKAITRALSLGLVVMFGCAGAAVAEDSSVGPAVVMGEDGQDDRLVIDENMLSEEMAEVADAKSTHPSSASSSASTSPSSSASSSSVEPTVSSTQKETSKAQASEPSLVNSPTEVESTEPTLLKPPSAESSAAEETPESPSVEVSTPTNVETSTQEDNAEASTSLTNEVTETTEAPETTAGEEDAIAALNGLSPEGIPDENDPLFSWMSEDAQPSNEAETEKESAAAEQESAAASSSAQKPAESRSMSRALAVAAAANLTCSPGSYYSTDLNGVVYRGTKSGTTYTAPTRTFQFRRNTLNYQGYPYYGSQVNGLGINSDGSIAYALDRFDWANTVDILRYNTATGTSTVPKRITIQAPRGTNFSTTGIVGGAVSKKTGDNDYYFGGFTTGQVSTQYWVPPRYEWRPFYDRYGRYLYHDWYQVGGGYYETVTEHTVRFNLWRYDAETNTVAYLGYTPVVTSYSPLPPANGDISFDAEGNLYVLYSTTSQSKIVPITKESIAAAESRLPVGIDDQKTNEYYELAAQATPALPGTGAVYYGMTFISDGTIVAQTDDNNGLPRYVNIDPATGKVVSSSLGYSGVGEHTDTAGCNSFPTIALEKDFQRANSNHEVKLEILQKGNNIPVGSAVTNGLEPDGSIREGRQDEFAGPVPARAGQTYILRETGTVREGTAGAAPNANEYNVTLQCVNDTTGAILPVTDVSTVTSPPTRQYEVVVPNSSTSVAAVTCKYVNKARVGALTFNKTDTAKDGSISMLAGSEWELRQTDAPAGTTPRRFALKDCVAEIAEACLRENYDLNPAEGEFLVDNIPYGKYELVETKAPTGYELLKNPIPVTVDRGSVSLRPVNYNEKDLGNIDNVQITGTVIWQKLAENPNMPSDPSLLGGSTWTITPVDANNRPTGAARVIEDCIAAGCTEDLKDSDPSPGDFLIKGLPSGRYALQETKAPLGFRVDPTIRYFIVPDSGSVNVGSFVNDLIVEPTLPKTGSYGVAPLFAFAGLIIAVGLALGMRRQWLA